MKKHLLMIAAIVFSVGFISAGAIASVTLATFADPSLNSSNPLFTVDFLNSSLTGGWADARAGLTLEIPYNGNTFSDVWFDMTPVSIIDSFGTTGSGTIRFFQAGTLINPLVKIDFINGSVSRFGFGADEVFVANNVTITGSEITNTLSDEEFAFSFANKQKLLGAAGSTGGFTATAAFTSSAVVGPLVPEPATIALLSIGALSLLRRKKH
ncbi:MAG: PEP-CTERM sorting domain-containing protein [Phycisphaerae bacterium]|jgi:hypothetical protein